MPLHTTPYPMLRSRHEPKKGWSALARLLSTRPATDRMHADAQQGPAEGVMEDMLLVTYLTSSVKAGRPCPACRRL